MKHLSFCDILGQANLPQENFGSGSDYITPQCKLLYYFIVLCDVISVLSFFKGKGRGQSMPKAPQ